MQKPKGGLIAALMWRSQSAGPWRLAQAQGKVRIAQQFGLSISPFMLPRAQADRKHAKELGERRTQPSRSCG